jgi:hypothetical protein
MRSAIIIGTLIKGNSGLEEFRRLFGDDRIDYPTGLSKILC